MVVICRTEVYLDSKIIQTTILLLSSEVRLERRRQRLGHQLGLQPNFGFFISEFKQFNQMLTLSINRPLPLWLLGIGKFCFDISQFFFISN